MEKIDENSTDDYKTNSVSSIHHNLSQSSNIHPKVSSYRETSRNSINLDDEDDIVLNGFHNEINYRSQYNSNDKDDEDSLVVTMEHMTKYLQMMDHSYPLIIFFNCFIAELEKQHSSHYPQVIHFPSIAIIQ